MIGFSVITDACLPDALRPVDIDRNIATAMASAPKLSAIVQRCIAKI